MQHQIIALPQHGAAFRHNLPTPLTPLIGREREVASASTLLKRPEVRLVTFTGTGGVGKTRLGLQVATELMAEFPDGVFLVSLAPISDPDLVIPTIAQTLQVREVGGGSLLDLLKVFLAEKQVLLLLDNFEQILTAAPQLTDLLASCPDLKLLVTSRAVLHVQGEHEFPVPPLALPDPRRLPDLVALSHYAAVALFLSRTQAFKPNFTLTAANAKVIADICIRLDGLPLAIELAAARVKILSPHALLARLEHRLQVLTSGLQDAPTRQQTLRNTIAWSYDLLTPQEQRLFRRLSIFVGGCTLQAIEALCTTLDGEAEGVLDGIASLLDKSLLRQTQQENEEPRFVMLETIREYGLQVLSTCGEREVVEQAHATYYLKYAEEAEAKFAGRQETIFDHLEREHENLRAALNWWLVRAEGKRALRLAKALGGFWLFHCHWSEGRNFLERTLALVPREVTLLRARVLEQLSVLLLNLGELARAEELDRESLALARELGDTEYLAGSLHVLAIIVMGQGNFAAAHPLFEECVALSRFSGESFRLPNMLCNWANLAIRQGEYERAHTLAEEGLALYREQGRLQDIPSAFWSLAEVSFCQGNLTQAYILAEEGFGLCVENFHRPNQLSLLGEIVLRQGDASRARTLIEESLMLYKEAGDTTGICWSLTLLGKVASMQGNDAVARTLYEQSLQFSRKQGHRWEILSGLEGLASVVTKQGEFAWATRLWGMAEALRQALGAPLPSVYRADYERSIAATRAQLGEKAFAVAWAEGRGMTLEQVLFAREPVQPTAPSPEPSSPTYPDGLTAREVEVLRLVAQGLSNAEIAEQLIISLLTVKAHMRSLYNKLGISSRSAATRYALEHELV